MCGHPMTSCLPNMQYCIGIFSVHVGPYAAEIRCILVITRHEITQITKEERFYVHSAITIPAI